MRDNDIPFMEYVTLKVRVCMIRGSTLEKKTFATKYVNV